ncbi:MAG: hypothetical protein ACLT3H_12450 [Roseburia sp.]
MRKERLSDFEKMCKSLDVWRKNAKGNEIVIARKAIKSYVGSDNDKLVKLKAEAKEGDYWLYLSENVAQAALMINLLALFAAMIGQMHIDIFVYIFLGADVIMALMIISFIGRWPSRYHYIHYWRKYIIAIIDEMDLERV